MQIELYRPIVSKTNRPSKSEIPNQGAVKLFDIHFLGKNDFMKNLVLQVKNNFFSFNLWLQCRVQSILAFIPV